MIITGNRQAKVKAISISNLVHAKNYLTQNSFHVVSIPQVAGDYSPSQIILACQTYVEKKVLLLKAMGHLVGVFRHWTGFNKIGALSVSMIKL